MFYINRMYETTRSHSGLTNRFIENALKNLGLVENVDYVFYPERIVDDTKIFLDRQKFEAVLASYGLLSMDFLLKNPPKVTDNLILFDPRALPYHQYNVTNIETTPQVFILCTGKGEATHYNSKYIETIDQTFLPMVYTKQTADVLGFSRFNPIGGFAPQMEQKSFCKTNTGIWSGRRIKGYKEALEFQKMLPTGTFKVIDAESSNLTSEGLYDELSNAKVVACFDNNIETFGYVVMQGVSQHCLPLLPKSAVYPYLGFDEMFYYTPNDLDEMRDKFLFLTNNYEDIFKQCRNHLESILKYYSPEQVVRRALYPDG